MKLFDILLKLNNGSQFDAECDCPYNYYKGEIPTVSFTPYCDEDGSGCDKCHNQELKNYINNYIK